MKTKHTHVAWDFGTIQDTVTEVLGHFPGLKTTKTLCKMRVKMENIDNKNPTYPECLEFLKRNPLDGENKNH